MEKSIQTQFPYGNTEDSCTLSPAEHCITCSDEAQLVTVICVNQRSKLALVQEKRRTLEVDISLIEQPQPGDTLLIHGGVAIATL